MNNLVFTSNPDVAVWLDPDGFPHPLTLEFGGAIIMLDDQPIAERDAASGQITMLDPGPARPAFTLVLSGPDGEIERIEGAALAERQDEAP
jgi:hypothetical protein